MLNAPSTDIDRQWHDLSLAQRAVWLDVKLGSASDYQLGGWARVDGPLDTALVRQSVSLIMARHDGLRLRVDDDLPRQWVDASVEPPFEALELHADTGEEDAVFQRHVEALFATPMPLGDRPLFGIQLVRINDVTFVLWRFHHLIADSYAVAITSAVWFEAYDALASGAARELAPPTSYLPTIEADTTYLESVALQRDLGYWTDRFEPLPPPLIPELKQRPSAPGSRATVGSWELTGEDFRAFEAAAQRAGVPAQRALFALFAVTLGRRYGQTDIVSGIALHRRELATRTTIGMLSGVIAMRCRFEPWWSLDECVQAFSEQMDDDLRHQRLPVDELARALGLAGTGRSGLFEAVMSYVPKDRSTRAQLVAGIRGGAVNTREASPISLHAAEIDGGVRVSVAVNPDFLDAADAHTLSAQLSIAVERFVADADAAMCDLAPASDAERALILGPWNATSTGFPTGTLDALFDEQVARTPDAVAVIDTDGRTLTYAELQARSADVARALTARGIAEEQPVGVCLTRSADTVVSLLGILKAGGVYVPLDPSYPAERRAYMIADAGVSIVIDSLDTLLETAGAADAAVRPARDPERLAYIIYTSGTTGQPKGVAMPHRAAVNLAFARRACHDPLGPGDRVLGGIAVGFDVSIGQLLLPLLSGATVVIAPDLKTLGPEEFWALIASRGVSHINSVPSFIESILDTVPRHDSLALRQVMLGGEALTGTLVSKVRAVLPGVRVVNMYGPTETCIDSTYHIATDADLSAAVLPIGTPLSNYTTYVLDPMLEPVGVGVAGELYVGGAGVARGYVNAPAQTADKFVADPFSGVRNARLYRTGDRARWRADGSIEFLGRVDQQVKIRGFRVEPGEVAAVLLEHDAVAQTVVVPHAAAQGGAVRLVAYVVPRPGAAMPETAALRLFLAQRLPDYMVPSAFVGLSAMPITANGKLNTAALPSPDHAADEYVPPRTPTEAMLAELFADVLGVSRVSAIGHFFELGGHSLLATKLAARLRGQGTAVPLRAIFEAPTVDALARYIDGAAHDTSASDGHGTSAVAVREGEASVDAIVATERPAQIPLSFSQERIWFVDQLQRDASYNIPLAFELQGALDVVAVRQALTRIVERHEALRTLITLHDGRPVQTILDTWTLPFEHVTISDPSPLLDALRWHRFDLASDLPILAKLVTLAPDRHLLAAVVHHAVFDGWSAAVFLQEFAALYAAFSAGGEDPLPTPSVQFADFALWQRAQDRSEQLAYWTTHLAGALPRIELPVRTGAPSAERAAGTHTFRIDEALHRRLTQLATAHGASLFMVLHAAFASLLSRWSGQDDVVIGTVTANRTHTEVEPVIGCFVNTLALRTTLQAGESFAALLGRVKNDDLAAYANQDVPFEQLVAVLQPDRSLDHTPLFQVMLVLQNAPAPVGVMPGLTLQPRVIAPATPKFDLTLTLEDDGGALSGVIEFATDRYDGEMMTALAGQFTRMLHAVAELPSQPIDRIPLLDEAEQRLVVSEWNATAQPFPAGTLEAMFDAQVARTPDGIAVIDSDGVALTYAQLDERSTALARRLVQRGIEPGAVVGVRMVRSAATVVSILGILKAGGVYLPLDPAYPAERLAYMIADSGAALVLTELDELPSPDVALPTLTDTGRTAYIIYTSGTTGKPKGVAVSHAAAVNLAFARRAGQDPLGPGDRVLAGISVGFDVSVGQLLLPLLCGATICVASELRTLGASGFWEFIVTFGVTHINSVPSFFEYVIDAAPRAELLRLQRVMLGGEPLTWRLVERIQRAMPGVEVANIYGPTEATIEALYHVVTPDDAHCIELPIGRPHANYTAYVLDRHMQPTGIGIAGELFLGGAGLASGYVNAPELTASRFVENPFGPGRLYRTGDRARWRRDGRMEFLGRVDEQVKIRGFRVEPGEIEARLRSVPEAGDVAVIADGGRLVAYFTGRATVDTLREAVAASLPDYMVPAAFVALDVLPLTTNGKLDRRALPRPGQDAFARRAYEAPVGAAERAIADLWSDLLGIEQVGRHDNFFELGGHSLLAVTLIERMRQRGLPGDVRALFTTPTVAGLAAAERFAAGREVVVPANGIPPEGTDRITPEMLPLVTLTQPQLDHIGASVPGGAANIQDIYPLAPLQEGMLFQHLMTEAGDPYLTPFLLGFDSRARVDAFLHALQAVARRHDVLRTAMLWRELDAPVQVVLRDAPVPVEESEAATAEELLAQYDPTTYRLDLSTAPLLRAVVANDVRDERWMVLLLTHHLVLDHTSMDLLVHEIRALMGDTAAPLPASLPYRNFVAQARAGATTGEYETFFRSMLADVETPTAPFGITDVQQRGSTAEVRLSLDESLSRQVRAASASYGVTPATLFHVAWASVLGSFAATDDVVFGTVLFGRMRSGAGADRVVGMFINTLPIRIPLGGVTVGDSVTRAHAALAELLAHEHAPLAVAQRASGISAPLPLFSSLFNYRYSPGDAESAAWEGVSVLSATERTNYPLAMAVDDLGVGFTLTALAQQGVDPTLACAALEEALRHLVTIAPDAPLTTLRVLPKAMQHRVVHGLNETAQPFPVGTLDGLFASQVQRTPTAVAVVGLDGKTLTYAALDAEATRVARALVAHGVTPGAVVGVRMPRSAETIVALLAILKAGAVYLPLDPAYPTQRLDYMIADSGATLVLQDLATLQGSAQLPQLDDPERVAYVIYTSGTTGQPKGVAMSHAAAVNLAFARKACHDPIGPGDRILAAISVGFDVSIGQLLLPLLSGATVVVADDLKTMEAAAFWALLAEQGVTHINSVPSFLASVLDALPRGTTLPLKRLMLGGEALQGALVQRIATVLPGVQVVNMYGPTEACIDATYHVATAADFDAAVLPIGRPLSNYVTYVLDSRRQPVSVGVEGELYIGGAGLACGYVNAESLTAERFVPNPFGAGRLYRTGDRARWRQDGSLEFLGRVDAQVKIRGFRVEPGEVEAQLRRVDGVREAAVIARGGRLVAYTTGDASPAPATLRAALAAHLPDYMVPSAFVSLAALPLTANGKLDQRALPEPDVDASVERTYEAPIGPVETAMATLWARALGLERVGRHDDFFTLGGHSLLAIGLVERMRQAGLPGDVRALFTTPTIASLAGTAAGDVPTVAPVNRLAAGTASITPEMLSMVQLTPAQIEAITAAMPGGAPNIQDIYPLSPLQEGLLFQHLLTTDGDPYITPYLLSFDTRERLDTFIEVMNRVIMRHDVLRTAVHVVNVPAPVQVVLREASLPVEELQTGVAAASELMDRFNPERFRFDLGTAPMLRAKVTYDVTRDRWLLLLLTHHLVLDHTSMEILVQELRTLMTMPDAVLPHPEPYRNFIAETRRTSAAEHSAFFAELLGTVDEPTAPYGLLDTRTGGRTAAATHALDASLSAQVRRVARDAGVTPAALFHLAWARVIGHVSNRTDVVFGTILLGRMRAGAAADRVVGMFINTLPMRVDLTAGSVRDAVRSTHAQLAALMAHEHAPLTVAQRASGVTAPTPLFSALFNFRQSPPAPEGQAEWRGVELVDSAERTNYPLSMAIDDAGQTFRCSALAQGGIDPSAVCALLTTAVTDLVGRLERGDDALVSDVAVLPEAQRRLVVDTWNATQETFPVGSLDQLFADQAARTPDAVAVVGVHEETLTYAALDRASTRLARALVAHGVRPGSVVGVRMPRSLDTVLALLAILKAGGVYLPLDPAYPAERLDYMVRDAGATLVIDSLAVLTGDADLPGMLTADRLAYIIYTSGTTGVPKGVAVSHTAAVNLAFARRACHDPIDVGDRVLASISVGFDVSIGQLLLPLLSGATVVVAGELRTLSGAEFWAFIRDRRVSHMNSVPSFLESILPALPAGGVPEFRRLMLGGEALTGALVQRIHAAMPAVTVVNMYGPTEACIDATYHVTTVADHDVPVVPIGRPLSNYRTYVLDERRAPVAPGVAGELYIGGVSLASHYVNAPEVTDARFVHDPFVDAPSARMYRTGDRARWRPDGTLEFLGRVDQQVKIRGFRVEPEEVAAVLSQHGAVVQAVVVARAGRLHAYVVLRDAVAMAELRAVLAERLPDYMVPASITALDAIPLNRNGKLDMQALPATDESHGTAHAVVPPRTALEVAVHHAFARVLERDSVSCDQSFFTLGGDSLGAMRLVQALHDALQVTIPMRWLFEFPTVEALACKMQHGAPSALHGHLIPLQPEGTQRAIFAVHPAGGHVFCYLPLSRALGTDQPFFALQASGLEVGESLGTSIAAMATAYVAAIRAVQPAGPYQLLGMSSGGLIAFEMARQLREAGDEVSKLVLLDTTVPGTEHADSLSDAVLLQAMAAELGCGDLLDDAPAGVTLAELVAMAHEARRLPPDVTLAHVERISAVFHNTVRAHMAYRPEPVDVPVLVVRATQRLRDGDALADWSPFVGADGLDVIDLECTHADLVSPALAAQVATLVSGMAADALTAGDADVR